VNGGSSFPALPETVLKKYFPARSGTGYFHCPTVLQCNPGGLNELLRIYRQFISWLVCSKNYGNDSNLVSETTSYIWLSVFPELTQWVISGSKKKSRYVILKLFFFHGQPQAVCLR
jgi:hypothetical protein